MGIEILLDQLFWGLSLGMLGKVMLGATVINVHAHIVKERKIDIDVIKEMKRERRIGVFAVFFILAGYVMELAYFNFLPF